MSRNPYIIAEIDCNHKGDMGIAHKMIKVCSVFCKVDAVKFQKRAAKVLLSDEEYNAPHPNPMHSYGDTYGEHREYLELDLDQHKQLMKWCTDENVMYSTSA